MVLSNTRSITAFILPFGVAQKPKYLTASDSGVRDNGSSRYVTVTASVRLATIPSIAISFCLGCVYVDSAPSLKFLNGVHELLHLCFVLCQ
jgi:hypothetical protein